MSEMQAGREMDALIAEMVMGWNVETNKIFEGGIGLKVSKGTTKAITTFCPSTDLNQAWSLTEVINLPLKIERISDGTCHVAFAGVYQAVAQTLPLAICRAALKALGVS